MSNGGVVLRRFAVSAIVLGSVFGGFTLPAQAAAASAEHSTLVLDLTNNPGSEAQAVAYAEFHGLQVISQSRTQVDLTGDASALASAFGAHLTGHGRQLHATVKPHVPIALRGAVHQVIGLDNRPVWHPRSVPYGYTGANLRSAYQVTRAGSTGAGITIATVQFSGYNASDVTTYANAAGITIAPGQLQAVSIEGASPTTPVNGGDVEAALDIETLLATAPQATQRVYVAPNTLDGAVAAYGAIADAVAAGQVQVVSTSWGECEQSLDSTSHDEMASQIDRIVSSGGTIFAASGDSGAYDCGGSTAAVDFPAALPSVVAVGGTTLKQSSGSWTETAWGDSTSGNGSGGGQSVVESRPAYQSSLAFGGDGRLVPDVSADADPQTGIGCYDSSQGGWLVCGGTSAAAPEWAGFLAASMSSDGITGGIGDIHPLLYAHPGAFRDVTSGNNFVFTAKPGFDEVTGLGSPQWAALSVAIAAAHAAPTATPSGGYTAVTPQRFVDSRSGLGTSRGRKSGTFTITLPSTVPSNATGVAVNLTVTGGAGTGYLALYPTGTADPGTSNVNYGSNTTNANLAVSALPGSRQLTVKVGGGAVYVIVDLFGYFADTSTNNSYVAMSPKRFVDTRSGLGATAGRKSGTFTITLPSSVPGDATGVAVNLTVTGGASTGYLAVYPSGSADPGTSNVNFGRNTTNANLAISGVPASRQLTVKVGGGAVYVIVDVFGYFAPTSSSTSTYVALTPKRFVDSRSGLGTSKGRKTGTFTITLPSSVPSNATGVTVNLTVTGGAYTGYVAVYPAGSSDPGTSNVNYGRNTTNANLAISALPSSRQLTVKVGGGAVYVIVDVFGYTTS